jgi:hypothetical protein
MARGPGKSPKPKKGLVLLLVLGRPPKKGGKK